MITILIYKSSKIIVTYSKLLIIPSGHKDEIQRKFEEIGGKYRMTYKIIASSDNSNINLQNHINVEKLIKDLQKQLIIVGFVWIVIKLQNI